VIFPSALQFPLQDYPIERILGKSQSECEGVGLIRIHGGKKKKEKVEEVCRKRSFVVAHLPAGHVVSWLTRVGALRRLLGPKRTSLVGADPFCASCQRSEGGRRYPSCVLFNGSIKERSYLLTVVYFYHSPLFFFLVQRNTRTPGR
jgi:hypothetical protein